MRQFLFILCFLVSIVAESQSAFTIFNADNSDLPDNLINVIYIDNDNIKWIGTQNGLVKIDIDDIWTIYNTTNSGLTDNDIRAIFMDEDNILWIGTYTKGLVKHDDDWTIYDPLNSLIPDYHVRSINKDINDTMWIGTTGGLAKWDGANFWYTYKVENSELLGENIPDIYIDENNIKYIGTINGGMSIYNNGVITTFKTNNSAISDNTVLAIDEDADHNKWIATSFGGLNIYTPGEVFLNFTPLTSYISDWSVNDVIIDNENVGVLAMSSYGINIFDNINWSEFTEDNSDLPDNFLKTVAVDQANKIWIGTESAGVVVFDRTLFESVNNINNLQISVFPNPISSYLIISGNIQEGEIIIYNIEGKIVLNQKIASNSTIIDIKDYISGNYFIKISDNKNTVIKHIVVIR